MHDHKKAQEAAKQSQDELLQQLESQLEKNRIITQNARRELEQERLSFSEKTTSMQSAFEQRKAQFQIKLQDAQQQINQFQESSTQQQQYQAHQQKENDELAALLAHTQNASTQLEAHCHTLQSDVIAYQSRARRLEQEADQHQKSRQPSTLLDQSVKFDEQIRRLNESHAQQLQASREENQDFRLRCSEAAQSAAVLTELQSLLQVEAPHILNKVRALSELQVTKQAPGEDPKKSGFAENLLHTKDLALQSALEQVTRLKDDNTRLGAAEAEAAVQAGEMAQELQRLKLAKERAEHNVQALKDQLRQELTRKQSKSNTKVAESARHSELLTQVMSLELAADPLAEINSTLQESFVDEEEQASQHLKEQSRLVQLERAALQSEIAALNEHLEDKSRSSKQLNQKMTDQFAENQQLSDQCQHLANQLRQLERSISEGQMFSQARFIQVLEHVVARNFDDPEQGLVECIHAVVQQSSNFEMSQIPPVLARDTPQQQQDEALRQESALLLEELSPTKHSACQTDADERLVSLQQLVHYREARLVEATELIEQLQQSDQTKHVKVQELKEQVMSELQLKTDELQVELDQVQIERTELEEERARMEQAYHAKLATLETQYSEESCVQEQRTQSDLTKLQSINHQLQSDLQARATDLSKLRIEARNSQSELDRLKRSLEHKTAQLQSEVAAATQRLESEWREKLADSQSQAKVLRKEAVDAKQQQIKSELMNKLSEVKNDHARQVAEWQRERSKFVQLRDEAVKQALKEADASAQEQVRQARAIAERSFRKQLDEKQRTCEQKVLAASEHAQELEQHLQELRKRHSDEVLRLRKRAVEEDRIRSATTQHEVGLQAVLSPVPNPRISNLPTPSPSQATSRACSCEQEAHSQLQQAQLYISELKQNFENELIAQEQIARQKQLESSSDAFTVLEQMISLEFDKILATLSHKQGALSQEELKRQRQVLNETQRQLVRERRGARKAFEETRTKLTLVLTTLKQSVEQKSKSAANAVQTSCTLESVRQSRDSSEVNLTLNSHRSPAHVKRRYTQVSESAPQDSLHKYIEVVRGSGESERDVLRRVAPQRLNETGNTVVEVQKVVADLEMLHESIVSSKYYRGLALVVRDSKFTYKKDEGEAVEQYRDLLNALFRLQSELNQHFDAMAQKDEVCRLRLLNVNIREQLARTQEELRNEHYRELVPEIKRRFEGSLAGDVADAVERLSQVHFSLSRDKFKLNQLVELFLKDGAPNANLAEVNQLCTFFNQKNQEAPDDSILLGKYLAPEELSPDQTAQLIAEVIRKMPGAESIGGTVAEEVLSKALGMYNQAQLMPLSRPPKNQQRFQQDSDSTRNAFGVAKQPVLKRARSIGASASTATGLAALNMPRQISSLAAGQSIYQTVEPPSQIKPSNRYPQPPAKDRYMSVYTVDRSGAMLAKGQTSLSSGDELLIEENDENTQLIPSQLSNDLAAAQSNVNSLFMKLKQNKFATLQY